MKKDPPSLKFLELALKLSPEPISFESLSNGFGLRSKGISKEILTNALNNLVEKGAISQDDNGQYQSTKPLSDIVIATLKEKPSGKAVPLEIVAFKGEQPFALTLSAKQIKNLETKEGKKLLKGSRVAVVVERRRGLEFRSKQLIGRVESGKDLTLTVSFNKPAEGKELTVTSHVPVSFTQFSAFGAIPNSINPKKDFCAVIPHNFTPYVPALEIKDARRDPETGTPIYAIIANKHGIPVRHSPTASWEAKKMANANFWKDVGRRNLKAEPILVIDPPNAHDNDDGILIEHSKEIINGEQAAYRTLVVVADMPFYVRSGSHLEREAQDRGFTHYFDDHAVHLYPPIFPDRKASLKSGKMKPVIYVEKFWDADGNALGVCDIGTAIIESQKVLSYGQFQDLVDVNDASTIPYQELGDKLIQQYGNEGKAALDDKSHSIYSPFSSMLVASMMQDANKDIAEMLEYYNLPYLKRAHGAKENQHAYRECKEHLDTMGYQIPENSFDLSIHDIQKILTTAEAKNERHPVEQYIRQYLLNQAKYTTEDVGHFGLNVERYTHATSPIRRYPDLLTLRAVHTAIGDDELGLSQKDRDTMADVATKMNQLQDIQTATQLDYERYNSVARLARQEGENRRVRFAGVRYPYVHIDITLGKRGALRQRLHVDELPKEWKMSKTHDRLIYDGNIIVPIGSSLKVTITDVFPEKGEWHFTDMTPSSKTITNSHMANNTAKAAQPKVTQHRAFKA